MKIIESGSIFFDRYERKGNQQSLTHFCPGCGHGNIYKWIAEAIVEQNLRDRCLWVSPVGCGGLTHQYLDVGHVLAAHGRASAVGTAIKRLNPESLVIVYQGDGDFAAIGLAESIHAANRGEHLSVFFVNNAVYAMTGGQMAPTTLSGQKTLTSPQGRLPGTHGKPLHICEMLAPLEGVCFAARVAVGSAADLMKARAAIQKAIRYQREKLGYSFVEILSPCPTNWHMSPVEARQWVSEQMTREFPTGIFKDTGQPAFGQEDAGNEIVDIEQYSKNAFQFIQSFSFDEKIRNYFKEKGHFSFPRIAVRFAGFGGQGVLSMGLFTARLVSVAGGCVSWLPSYGPEMRGGTCHCHVQISSDPVVSPLVEAMDLLVAMNQPSLERFARQVRAGGCIFYDGEALPPNFDLTTDGASENESASKVIITIPATQIATEMGEPRHANFVMLGAVLRHLALFAPEDVLAFLRIRHPDNEQAFLAGWNLSSSVQPVSQI